MSVQLFGVCFVSTRFSNTTEWERRVNAVLRTVYAEDDATYITEQDADALDDQLSTQHIKKIMQLVRGGPLK